MGCLAISSEQLNLVTAAVHEWSIDWGIEVGKGGGKTEVMYFPADGTDRAPAGVVKLGDWTVPWTDKYRYLGYMLQPNLGPAEYVSMIKDRMQSAANRYLLFNSMIQRMSVALQLQITNTLVLGCVNYLMGVVAATDAQAEELDKILRDVARSVLGANIATPRIMLEADARLISVRALQVQHRCRFQQYLRLTPASDAPAVHVMNALQRMGVDTKRVVPHWHDTTAQMLNDMQRAAGAPVVTDDVPESLEHIHGWSALIGRRCALAVSRLRLSATLTAKDRPAGAPIEELSPTGIASYMQHIGIYDTTWARAHLADEIFAKVGHVAYATPLSSWGAACDGSPLALSDKLKTPQSAVITNFRLGPHALKLWPFSAGGENDPIFNADLSTRACEACGVDVGSPFHFAVGCRHSSLMQERVHVWSAAKALLRRMVFLLRKAHRDLPVPTSFENAAKAVIAAISEGQPASTVRTEARNLTGTMGGGIQVPTHQPDLEYVLLRLLSCAPFSAREVREAIPAPSRALNRHGEAVLPPPADRADMPLATALGQLFDSIVLPRHHLRQFANIWTHWSYQRIMDLAGVYQCATSNPNSARHATRDILCPHCRRHAHRSGKDARHRIPEADWIDAGDAASDDSLTH